jgi:hypothetical protein
MAYSLMPALVIFGFAVWALVQGIRRKTTEELEAIRRVEGACIHCGYNLEGNVSGTCPECGRAIESDV